MSTTQPKEIYCLEDEETLRERDLRRQRDAVEINVAADDNEASSGCGSRSDHHLMLDDDRQHGHASSSNHVAQMHQQHHSKEHAPSCLFAANGDQPARYQHQPHCLHHDHRQHPHHHIHHNHHYRHHLLHHPQHKPTCALHNNQPLGSGGQKQFFKSLMAQQHVQLSEMTMKQAAHASAKKAAEQATADYKLQAAQKQHQSQQLRYPKAPQVDKSKYLLAEYAGHRPTPSGRDSVSTGSANNNGGRHQIDIRNQRRRSSTGALLTLNDNVSPSHPHHRQHHLAPTQPTQAGGKHKRTTINFIAQLYFLIHLSAMISLLLHHKNLVSSESRAIAQQQQQQYQHQHQQSITMQQQLMQAATRRSSQVTLPAHPAHLPTRLVDPPAAQPAHPHHQHHYASDTQRRRPMQPALATDDRSVGNESVPALPSLPVPSMMSSVRYGHMESNFKQVRAPDDQLNQTSESRSARSLPWPDLSAHSLDARSQDILVRLVGRSHAKAALQYYLCYLLSSSITILVFLWLVRICAGGSQLGEEAGRRLRGAAWPKRRTHERARLAGMRQDCTPVLIGSISLGLIQLIVIGLDIADNIDWATSWSSNSVAASATNGDSEQTRGQWPFFLPLLQFVFVSLLMQYILAKVARIRALIRMPDEDNKRVASEKRLARRSSQRGRQPHRVAEKKSLRDNLQNIALAHLIVTHILLWLMKLNSISLFASAGQQQQQPPQQQQVFNPFVNLPLPPPPPPLLPPVLQTEQVTETRSGEPAMSSLLPLPTTQRATSAPASTLGQATANTVVNSVASERGQRDNAETGAPTDERQRREKVLSPLQNANLFANNDPDDNNDNHSTTKQPQLATVATRATVSMNRASSSTSTPSVSTTGRPSERLAATTERAPIGGEATLLAKELGGTDDREEAKLARLEKPHVSPWPMAVGSSTRAPESPSPPPPPTRPAKSNHPANSTKDERDVHATGKQRQSAPESVLGHEQLGHIEPIFVVSERPATRQRVTLAPISAANKSQLGVQVQPAKSSAQPTLELRPANLSASLFRSSLPKRVTYFRQARPSQRVNLALTGAKSTSVSPVPSTTASSRPGDREFLSTLPAPQPAPQPTPQPALSPPPPPPPIARDRHKVRVIVESEEPPLPRNIDLSAVIPLPGAKRTETADDNDEQQPARGATGGASEDENETEDDARPLGSSTSTSRPFPSVDDDPPPSTLAPPVRTSTRAAATPMTVATTRRAKSSKADAADSGQADERYGEPNESVALADRKSAVQSRVLPPAGAEEDRVEEDEDGSSSSADDGDLDLEMLLPPVPNYNENTTNSDDETAELAPTGVREVRRQPRLLRGHNSTSSAHDVLLDEDAFVFNEAASSPVANVTKSTSSHLDDTVVRRNGTNSDPLSRSSSAIEPSNGTARSLESIGKEALTMQRQQEFSSHDTDKQNYHQQSGKQQQQHKQPTFTDFLAPIIQQYHILVLTILLNMWLDSMQRKAPAALRDQAGKHPDDAAKRDAVSMMMARRHHQPAAGPSERRATPKRHIVLPRSSSSSRDLSPARLSSSGLSSSSVGVPTGARSLSEADLLAPESSLVSRSSSTKRLVGAIELARDKQRAKRLARSAQAGKLGGESLDICSDSEQQQQKIRRRRSAAVDLTGASATQRRPTWQQTEFSSSVCSVFFGLLVVSGSLIVILLGVDLLSLLVQCSIQLISIVICLVGLCIVWRIKRGARARHQRLRQLATRHTAVEGLSVTAPTAPGHGQQVLASSEHQQVMSHKSSFHYLFLLAAYYCGISLALNLGQQHQIARLFPPVVVQALQRLLVAGRAGAQSMHDLDSGPTTLINFPLLFYCALTLKGLVLIVQVTFQTILIRSSWRWSSARAELRQIYTFLMFTNLSLWALEICDQQQQMLLSKYQQHQQHQQHLVVLDNSGNNNSLPLTPDSELLSLEGFTRFACSVVTLSHLYHGLVFMQH